jgi:hypothetical protein
MTIDDQFPAFIGFSQADAFDYLHQFGPRVDVRRQEDEVCEYRAHLQQGGFWTSRIGHSKRSGAAFCVPNRREREGSVWKSPVR